MRWTECIVGLAVHLNAGACLTYLSVPIHRFPIRDQPNHPCPRQRAAKAHTRVEAGLGGRNKNLSRGLQDTVWVGTLSLWSMLHWPIGFHLWNTNSNIKWLRISRWQPQSIKAICNCPGCMPWRLSLNNNHSFFCELLTSITVFLLNVLNIYSQVFLFTRSCTNEQSGRRSSIFFGIPAIIFMHIIGLLIRQLKHKNTWLKEYYLNPIF